MVPRPRLRSSVVRSGKFEQLGAGEPMTFSLERGLEGRAGTIRRQLGYSHDEVRSSTSIGYWHNGYPPQPQLHFEPQATDGILYSKLIGLSVSTGGDCDKEFFVLLRLGFWIASTVSAHAERFGR